MASNLLFVPLLSLSLSLIPGSCRHVYLYLSSSRLYRLSKLPSENPTKFRSCFPKASRSLRANPFNSLNTRAKTIEHFTSNISSFFSLLLWLRLPRDSSLNNSVSQPVFSAAIRQMLHSHFRVLLIEQANNFAPTSSTSCCLEPHTNQCELQSSEFPSEFSFNSHNFLIILWFGRERWDISNACKCAFGDNSSLAEETGTFYKSKNFYELLKYNLILRFSVLEKSA